MKCFDMLLPFFIIDLLVDLGFDREVAMVWRQFYRQLIRRFKHANSIGKPWKSVNAMLQGCSLTMMALNCLLAVLVQRMANQLPRVWIGTIADDTTVTAQVKDTFTDAINQLLLFDRLTGQRLHSKRHMGLARHPRHAKHSKPRLPTPLSRVKLTLSPASDNLDTSSPCVRTSVTTVPARGLTWPKGWQRALPISLARTLVASACWPHSPYQWPRMVPPLPLSNSGASNGCAPLVYVLLSVSVVSGAIPILL